MSLTPRERERLDALVGAYKRLPKAEPSPELDAAVLANARAAVAKPAAKGGRPRWPGLLATAATLTVAVGLAWQLRTADRRVESEVPQAVVPAPQSAPAPAPAPAPADDGALRDAAPRYVPAPAAAPAQTETRAAQPIPKPAVESAGAPPARRVQRTTDDAALAKRPAAAQEAARSRASTAPPAGPSRDASDAADARKRAAEPFPAAAEAKQAAPAPPEPEPPVVFEEPLPMAEEAPPPVATPAEPESVLLQEPMPADASEAEAPREAVPAAPPAPPAPATAARPEPPAKAASTQPADASTRGQENEGTRVTGSRTKREDRAAQAPAVAGALGAAAAVREPRAWLDDIERLLREGRREQAIAELERFRAAYPDHELPRALRDLKP